MKVAIVGCGVMGSAFARSLSQRYKVILVGKNPDKLALLSKEINAPVFSIKEACEMADVIILGFKPKDLAAAANQMKESCKGKVVISLLAGTTTAVLKNMLPESRIVRLMPNLALTCKQGIVGVAEEIDSSEKDLVEAICKDMGLVFFLPEDKMDAFTALCGSSPAFIFVILEAMIEAGVSLGFTFNSSRKLIYQAFEGAIALAKSSGLHPAELKMQVASPAGTTIAGLKEMELHNIRYGLMQTIHACFLRSQELSNSKK